MASKVFGIKRKFVEFKYDFLDGETANFKVLEPTGKMIRESVSAASDIEKSLDLGVEQFKECLRTEQTEDIDKLITEQNEEGNIYDFIKEIMNLLEKEKTKKTKN